MICELCGKDIEITQRILSYYDLHECITGTDILSIYDSDFNRIYHGLPLELETNYGIKIQDFCKSFLQKEIYSRNPYLFRALRLNTVQNIIDDLMNNIQRNNI